MTTEYSDGDILYGVDMDNLVEGISKDGVLSGLAVSENTPTQDMNVIVALGNCFANATYRNFAAQTTVTLDASHASLNRLDLIIVNSAGTRTKVTGTAASPPNPPDLPDGAILLAIVEVDAGVTAIYNADIIDRRLFLGSIQTEMVGDGEVTEGKITFSDSGGHAHAGSGGSGTKVDHGSLNGLGDHDHTIYPRKGSAETITGGWKFDNDVEITGGPGNKLILTYGAADQRIQIDGDANQGTMYCDRHMVFEVDTNYSHKFMYDINTYVQIGKGSVYTGLIIAATTYSRDLYPGTDCYYSLGTSGGSLNWNEINVGTIDDLNCSIYPEPTNAFEVLATLKQLLPQGAPKGKIDSNNIPLPLKGWDPIKQQPKEKGRSLSQTVNYLLFAMGDLKDLLDNFEQRLSQLEAS